MKDADLLRTAFAALEVNDTFTGAVVRLNDQSELRFVHCVDERTVHATRHGAAALAASLLPRIARFRLNAKHLEIQFADGSRWEARLST